MTASSHPTRRRWRFVLLAAAFVLALSIAADVVVYVSGRSGISTAPDGPAPTWIVVPGASVHRDGRLSPILEERMATALAAARRWPQARLLLSGTSIPGGYSEPDAMRAWMLDRSVAPSRIVLDRSGTDTRSTIRNLGPPAGEVVIASQDWHLPRALWCARHAGWSARGLAAPERGQPIRSRLREHAVRVFYFLRPS